MVLRPILTVMLLAACIPELITGNTPLGKFIQLPVLMVLLVGYAIPVLLIRDLAVRRKLNLRGLIFLGLAYGLFNEGLLAKTIITQAAVPAALYNHYGYWFGISMPWAAVICLWHAFASVTMPIALTNHTFPQARDRPWLPRWLALVLAIAEMILAVQVFLRVPSAAGAVGTPLALALILAAMTVLTIIGLRCTRAPTTRMRPPSSIKPLLAGASLVIPFVTLAAMAGHKAPAISFFLVLTAFFLFYAWVLKRLEATAAPGFLYFGLGLYAQNGVSSIFAPSADRPRAVVAALVSAVIVIVVWRLIRRRPTGDSVQSSSPL